MPRRTTEAASPSPPAPPGRGAPPGSGPSPGQGAPPPSARASDASRKSLKHAARTSQVATTTETQQQQQQDDATFEGLVATDGEEEQEEGSSSALRVSEHVETAHASSSPSKKKSMSLSKLQPKGAWKMYDNLSVDHDRRNERGRVQRNANRPNYDDSRQRVFGHESASNEKKKKKKEEEEEEENGSEKPDEEAAASPRKKPRGRPPIGKVWDDDACAYVSADAAAALPIRKTGAKKTAPPDAKKKTTKTELASEVADLKQDVAAMKTEMKDGFAALRDLLTSKREEESQT